MSTIQPATPGDPGSAASLIRATDPGVWDYLFAHAPEDFDTFAAALWRAPGNSYSHEHAFEILDEHGQRIGLEVAYTGGIERELTRRVGPIASEVLSESSLAALQARAEYIDYLTPAIPARDLYLHFLSVAPSHRGSGLGRRLLAHFEDVGRKAGARALHLDVYVGNPAIEIYRAAGYGIVVETRFPGKTGLPPHYRMIRELS